MEICGKVQISSMKKLLIIISFLYGMYFLSLVYLDYCNWPYVYCEEGRLGVKILKPIQYGNEDFLKMLIKLSQSTKTELIFELTEEREEKTQIIIYQANAGDTGKNVENFLYLVKMRDLMDMKNLNLAACDYYISGNEEKFLALLKDGGVLCYTGKNHYVIKKNLTLKALLYPTIVLAFAILFLIMSKKRVIVIKRMHGYGDLLICMQILCEILLICVMTFVVADICFYTVLYIRYGYVPLLQVA